MATSLYNIALGLILLSLFSCIEDPVKTSIDDKYISSITSSGEKLFITTSEGKIYSSENERDWTNVPLSNSLVLLDIKGNENGIVVFTGDNGVFFISKDYGESWEKKSTGIASFLKEIVIINDSTYVAGGSSGSLIKTTDFGETWVRISTPFSSVINCLAIKDEKIFIGLRSNLENSPLLYYYDTIADTLLGVDIEFDSFVNELTTINGQVYLSDFSGCYILDEVNGNFAKEDIFINTTDNFITQKILFDNEIILIGFSGFNIGKVVTGIPSNQEIKEFKESLYFNSGIVFNKKLIVCGGDENEIAIYENGNWEIIKLK